MNFKEHLPYMLNTSFPLHKSYRATSIYIPEYICARGMYMVAVMNLARNLRLEVKTKFFQL